MSKNKPIKHILWCDAEANARRMSTTEGVRDIVERASRAGVDSLIVDVKPLGGEVLYKSSIAPRLGDVEGFVYPESFDLLSAFIEEGRSNDLRVYAAINVFSEGHRQWGRGPAYENSDWQVTLYEAVREIEVGGQTVEVDFVDPWETPDSPALYTRKSGTSITQPGRFLVSIEGDSVVSVSSDTMPVPEKGSVLSLVTSIPGVESGDKVTWNSRPVFRSAEESSIPSWGLFVNPVGSAREHELMVVEEIARGYNVDGIVFDRMRYPNLYADFSETSRELFEKWLGTKVERWPDDILRISDRPWEQPTPGRYYKEWLEWRALQIRCFVEEAVPLIKSIRPNADAGVYVGSWYESYFDVGVNWGSSNFHAGYPWMTPTYNTTGYAEFFDFICTGCYYPHPTREDARKVGRPEGATVEAACELSEKAIAGAAPFYGSLYLRDYAGKPEVFSQAVDVALRNSDGVMLFDLVYLYDYGWWEVLEEALNG